MNVTILGAGSVGLGLAATLATAGAKVRLIARGESAQALRTQKLSVTGALGEHSIPAGTLSIHDAENPDPACMACDVFAVTTKVYEVTNALKPFLPLLRAQVKPPVFLLTQNGWGSAQEARELLPAGTPVFSASIMTGLERRSPTHMNINAHVNPVRVGSLFGDAPEKISPLLDILQKGFWPFAYTPDIENIMLTKLIFNVCLNPTGALIGCTYGELTENAHSKNLLINLADEAVKVLTAARGFRLFESGQHYVESDLIPLRMPKAGPHRSSMLQDIQAGRKTEIDYINGAISRMGREHAIATPCNDSITALIHACEETAAKKRAV